MVVVVVYVRVPIVHPTRGGQGTIFQSWFLPSTLFSNGVTLVSVFLPIYSWLLTRKLGGSFPNPVSTSHLSNAKGT